MDVMDLLIDNVSPAMMTKCEYYKPPPASAIMVIKIKDKISVNK
jgi:hypothetical protein